MAGGTAPIDLESVRKVWLQRQRSFEFFGCLFPRPSSCRSPLRCSIDFRRWFLVWKFEDLETVLQTPFGASNVSGVVQLRGVAAPMCTRSQRLFDHVIRILHQRLVDALDRRLEIGLVGETRTGQHERCTRQHQAYEQNSKTIDSLGAHETPHRRK
jgi:hypothetical protein